MLQNTITRASLMLGAFSQHIFGSAIAGARAIGYSRAPSRIAPTNRNPAGSKSAGTRGMHSPEMLLKFRPMAHGKLGKKSSAHASGRARRTQQRQNAHWLELLVSGRV